MDQIFTVVSAEQVAKYLENVGINVSGQLGNKTRLT